RKTAVENEYVGLLDETAHQIDARALMRREKPPAGPHLEAEAYLLHLLAQAEFVDHGADHAHDARLGIGDAVRDAAEEQVLAQGRGVADRPGVVEIELGRPDGAVELLAEDHARRNDGLPEAVVEETEAVARLDIVEGEREQPRAILAVQRLQALRGD